MPYSFGWSDADAVDIPFLDDAIGELKNVCERYGIGFSLERCEDYEGGHLVIVPFERGEWDIFTDRLDEYESGIGFLDDAKGQYIRNREATRAAELEAQEAARSDAEAARVRHEAAFEVGLKARGVTLSDGHYRLVKDEGNV